MGALILLTAPDCHLCAHGRGVLDELGADWREVGSASDEGRLLARSAPPLRPVLYQHGHVIAYGRLSLKRLRKQLHRQEVSS